MNDETSKDVIAQLMHARREAAYYRKLARECGERRLRETEELSTLIAQLRQTEQELACSQAELELRVQERTTALELINARLIREMHKRWEIEKELLISYDATIEGWAHALELRDAETEGHCRRVTDLTLKLAQSIGFSDEDLVHIRRGAILHDIGKLAIPDAILLKPGPLTDQEYAVMQQHTVYARDMLAPITFLQPALDIPYCHHEKWDGTGYPRHLKGEEIPLAARLFAVIDVYDALCSDRPYRPRWTDERALTYILEQAGIHFDPDVVAVFLTHVEPLVPGTQHMETLWRREFRRW